MRLLLSALALASAGRMPPPGPGVDFLYGAWEDGEGRSLRLRGIETRLPNAPGVTYFEGRFELRENGARRIGAWNFGQTRPYIILNVIPYDAKQAQYWAVVQSAPDRAGAWVSDDIEALMKPDRQQRAQKRELRRVDSLRNPEPKMTREELHLPAQAEILN
ncbi:MAG: hypothetical protein SFV54_23775 [Bryobacteraceae bacterium]|nr:hypothetical protein [Bryobacteraceae bacterium]